MSAEHTRPAYHQPETMQKVVDALKARGFAASHEYPGFISIGRKAYGTANPTWGWNTQDGERGGEFSIPSDSTDVDAIVNAIAKEAKQDFLDRLNEFTEAALALNEEWNNAVDETGETFSDEYPFNESFDELVLGIIAWKHKCEVERKPYTLIWGAGETEQGRQSFDTIDQVRGMLENDTDLNAEQIEGLILKGSRSDADDDPQAATQFDCAWIRLERLAR